MARALAVVAVLSAALIAAAPSSAVTAQSGGRADPEGILQYATELTVSGTDRALDPIRSRSVGDFQHLNLIYFTLLQAQDDGDYLPGLAESYDVEGDNAVTLTLRDGLEFSDGTPLDAEAVKFSIDRAVAARNTNFAPEINNVESVEVLDPLTVRITLRTPTIGSFFELLAGRETMPVSPTAAPAPVNPGETRSAWN